MHKYSNMLSYYLFNLLALMHYRGTMVWGTGTEDSTLHCDDVEATPGERFTCSIQLLDVLQEPTIAASVSDFSVHVSSDVPEAMVSVTSLERAEGDATLLHFHVSSDMGCHLRVDVVLTSNRRFIRNSGITLLVLASPPTAIGPLECGDETFKGGLALRDSVECSAQVTGAHGIPALVRQTDVVLSEDHSDGAIHFLDGRQNLKIRFTAPIKPSLRYSDFVLRVSLAGNRVSGQTSLALPVIYPALSPSSRTTLSCTRVVRTDQSYCNLEAFDDVGPIKFDATQFDVLFEWQPSKQIKRMQGIIDEDDADSTKEDKSMPTLTDSNAQLSSEIDQNDEKQQVIASTVVPSSDDAWMAANDLFTWDWVIDGERVASTAKLHFFRVSNDFVFPFRLHVRVKTAVSETPDVTNSPFVSTSGVAPTPVTVSFEACNRRFMSAGQRTDCTVRVDSGTSADPTFITAQSAAGEAGLPHVVASTTNDTSLNTQYNPLLIRFPFIAPEDIKERLVCQISVTVESIVVGSTRLVVYPRVRTTDDREAERIEQEKEVQKILGVGLTFFIAAFVWGLIVFIMRLRRISHVKAMRRQVEENQLHADLAQRRQQHVEARRRAAERTSTVIASDRVPMNQVVEDKNDNDRNVLMPERSNDASVTPNKRVEFSIKDAAGAAMVPPSE